MSDVPAADSGFEHLSDEGGVFEPLGRVRRSRPSGLARRVRRPVRALGRTTSRGSGWAPRARSWTGSPSRRQALRGGFDDLDYTWFDDGKLNVSANCLDRHLGTWRRNKAALIWEGDDGSSRTYTYQHLHHEVGRFANVLRKKGVGKGDRVALYLPMIPELADRDARVRAHRRDPLGRLRRVLGERASRADPGLRREAAHHGRRGICAVGGTSPLKAAADEALFECPTVEACIVVSAGSGAVDMEPGRDTWWHQEMAAPEVRRPCRDRADGRRGPALHPLHVRARPASPRACSTRPPATCSTRR